MYMYIYTFVCHILFCFIEFSMCYIIICTDIRPLSGRPNSSIQGLLTSEPAHSQAPWRATPSSSPDPSAGSQYEISYYLLYTKMCKYYLHDMCIRVLSQTLSIKYVAVALDPFFARSPPEDRSIHPMASSSASSSLAAASLMTSHTTPRRDR